MGWCFPCRMGWCCSGRRIETLAVKQPPGGKHDQRENEYGDDTHRASQCAAATPAAETDHGPFIVAPSPTCSKSSRCQQRTLTLYRESEVVRSFDPLALAPSPWPGRG